MTQFASCCAPERHMQRAPGLTTRPPLGWGYASCQWGGRKVGGISHFLSAPFAAPNNEPGDTAVAEEAPLTHTHTKTGGSFCRVSSSTHFTQNVQIFPLTRGYERRAPPSP